LLYTAIIAAAIRAAGRRAGGRRPGREVQPCDPVVLGVVVAIVASVGTVSAAMATLRGLRIDPASALRDE
jgi:hypothetical protein